MWSRDGCVHSASVLAVPLMSRGIGRFNCLWSKICIFRVCHPVLEHSPLLPAPLPHLPSLETAQCISFMNWLMKITIFHLQLHAPVLHKLTCNVSQSIYGNPLVTRVWFPCPLWCFNKKASHQREKWVGIHKYSFKKEDSQVKILVYIPLAMVPSRFATHPSKSNQVST